MTDLHAAWRALAGGAGGEGWSTIPIACRAPCLVLAGRRLPGDEEALLFGFASLGSLPSGRLPQGQGFEMTKLAGHPPGDRSWLALAKRTGASTEFFTMMAEDLLRLLEAGANVPDDVTLNRLVARVSAWQDFMERHRDGVLSLEAEMGLFGELIILERSIDLGVEPRMLLDAWQGPLGADQDFIPGTGAVEVKTTLATKGFPASVPSLEQLDDSVRQPLYLAALRLALDPTGETLPERAAAVRARLEGRGGALDIFEARLLQGGLLPASAARYTRRFAHRSSTVLAVTAEFPRLTRAHVHPAIGRARYDIDLDLAGAPDIGLERALKSLGAI